MENIILVAECVRNQRTPLKFINEYIHKHFSGQTNIGEYKIDPLSISWNSELEYRHFRSGCAPISALKQADQDLADGKVDVAVIQGRDLLRTGYSKEERHRLMDIYDGEISILEGYNQLAKRYIHLQGIDEEQFIRSRDLLFINYLKTAKSDGISDLPGKQWFENVTSLFRGVDCANPLIDFEGGMILCSESFARKSKLPLENAVKILTATTVAIEDGPKNIGSIAHFDHLRSVYQQASDATGFEFVKEFLNGNGRMEVYTCYPVLPLAFLETLGFIENLSGLEDFLKQYEITITGGMNLARAPWNNPSLYGLIRMTGELRKNNQQYGLVHGNGGLGYYQGIAILEKMN
ncbi:MAG: hypothetical protein GY786_24690 [Proteobacteria bacterium]|nr:hypothetical protein [Pseudomonadota bacterium]